MVQNKLPARESSFGISPSLTWYEQNIGKQVTLLLHGSVARSGIIKGVDLKDGKVVLNPYVGRDYSTGKELEALISHDERVVISAIMSERVHTEGHFENYFKTLSQ